MKNLFLLFLILLLTLSACRENPSPCPGSSCAKLNGKKWKGAAFGKIQKDSIAVLFLPKPTYKDVCRIEGYSQFFHFQIKPLKIIRHTIQKNCNTASVFGCSGFDIREGGDVVANSYIISESEDNFLNITQYDSITHEVKGTFQITFVKDWSQQQLNDAPDTIRFTEGEFETVLEVE
ncbi:MAG: hypothetical protein K1X92_08565 [Bacteroidia bacterium]|nr:hypothetical protein [Bacteroidia bacterium]